MPPPTEILPSPSTSKPISPHTHAPTNLTLPNIKKSPISHLDDLDSDDYAFLRFLFILAVIGGIIGVWLTVKFRMRARNAHAYGSSSSAEYKPLRVDDVLEISSDEDNDDVILKLVG